MSLSKSILRVFGSKNYSRVNFRSRHSSCEFIEEKIPVPWGHISGKLWNNGENQPVLALHGMFDNAGSFDSLIPYLKINRSILALDIPGYGKSSKPPAGLSPNFLENIFWLRYLIKYHFKWEKATLLGHSFGSNLSFNYSGIFPNDVDKYISIDCSRVNMSAKPEYLIDDLRRAYKGNAKKENEVMREGSYEAFFNNTMQTRTKVGLPISKEMCETLLERDLVKISDNHYWSNVDPRIHLKYVARPTLPFLNALSKRIKCDVLSIRASDGIIVNKRLEEYEKHLNNMKVNKLVSVTAKGRHHIHMENPKEVADIINEFFK